MGAEDKSDLKKIINAILKELSGIEAIYLFGSIAKGEENEKSDYDIAVIVREYPEKDLDKISRIRYSLLGKIKRPLRYCLLARMIWNILLRSSMKYTMQASFSMGQIYCSGVKML